MKPTSRRWNSLIAVFLLTLSTAALGAVKNPLTEADAQIDYFAVLGLRFEDSPTPQEVVAAYARQMESLRVGSLGKSTVVRMADVQLLADAKEILTDQDLRAQYVQMVVQRFARSLRYEQLPSDLPPLQTDLGYSKVGTLIFTGDKPIIAVAHSFNTRSLERPISYYRSRPQENPSLDATEDVVDGAPATFALVPPMAAAQLSDQWQNWRGRDLSEIQLVENEFMALGQSNHPANQQNSAEFKKAEAFFYWWFAQPQSVLYPEFVIKALAQMSPGSPLSVRLMKASVSDPAWRTRAWVKHLLPLKDSYFALAPVAGTPEIVTETNLIEAILNLPLAREYTYIIFDSLGPSPRSLHFANWFEQWILGPTGAELFLRRAANQPHWRNGRPDLITKALLVLGQFTTGSRKEFLRLLMTKKDSINHPEWLEVLVKTDQFDYLTVTLNQILALDHWYNHPYLKQICRGAPLSVQALREARWVPVTELPHLVAVNKNVQPRTSEPTSAPEKFRIVVSHNRCESIL